ncbi:MAG: 3-isopropylmalate dehydratase small subunit [Synergistaceae bacterium]|nr:3-isopropylmalate dehydratase small subunit [Synergistaceae bacterium]
MSTAHKYGDHVDTDVIIPARYLNSQNEKELASHCMEDIDAGFTKKVKNGDIIVAGLNFGCGSSREHAPVAIKASGISCVIAKSFARIFYRNAINIGLAILECPEAAEDISDGDDVSVDFDTGIITNSTKRKTYRAEPFPEFIKQMIADGGLMASLKKSQK